MWSSGGRRSFEDSPDDGVHFIVDHSKQVQFGLYGEEERFECLMLNAIVADRFVVYQAQIIFGDKLERERERKK